RTRYLQSLHAFDCPEARKQGLDHGVDGAERHAAAVAPVRLDGSRDALRRLLTEALERRDTPVIDGWLQVSYIGDSELAPQRGGLRGPDSLDLDDVEEAERDALGEVFELRQGAGLVQHRELLGDLLADALEAGEIEAFGE